jgi:hypothetical protein
VRIVDPTYGVPDVEEAPAAVSTDVPAGSLCLFSNSKPGADDLLTGVRDLLQAERGFGAIGYAAKPSAAAAAATTTIDHLAEQYRMAVVAIGD